jgi:hypothetical protein
VAAPAANACAISVRRVTCPSPPRTSEFVGSSPGGEGRFRGTAAPFPVDAPRSADRIAV